MLTVDRVAGVVLAAFGLFVVWQSLALPLGSLGRPGPGYMPLMLAVFLSLGGLAIAALGGDGRRLGSLGFPEWRHGLAILVAGAFSALAIERLGYRLTMFVVLLFLLGVVERKRPLAALGFALLFAGGTFLLFDTVLRVPLPRGPFAF